jgi:serine/threonine protein kinase
MTEETIFTAALARTDPQERQAYLEQACGDNLALRREVEALLATHEADSGFLQRPAPEQLAGGSAAASPATEALAPSPDSGPAHAQPAHAASPETQAEGKAAGDIDLAFLAPATETGQLGRLGHYQVQEVVGTGGFGVVLKAFDERLHRVVAIKVLASAFAANGSARKRFIREARAAAAVKNEHVVGIYDVQEDANPPYLVMEFVDGASLQDKINRHGPLGVTEILRIGMQIAEGLAAAHKQGKVHRDIKPANILLENGVERVKITDFGLARAVDDASVTQSGMIAGTPMYMSPEQAEGSSFDHRSDLFSLGTVLYAMCTGHPPFRATGTMAVLKRVIEETPRSIRTINLDIPEWLCAIVARLHAKKPEDRYQTAREVADVLGQGLAHVQQPAHTAGPVTMASAAGRWQVGDRVPAEAPKPPAEPSSTAPLPANRWCVGAQVLAPLVPEWLYVCEVLEVKEDSVLVTFGAQTAWIQAAHVLPDDIGQNTRVLGYLGWWSGHRPGTVTERHGDRVHVLYDHGRSEWTKLSMIVVPANKLASPDAVQFTWTPNPNGALSASPVVSPWFLHLVWRGVTHVFLGAVLGAALGTAYGLTGSHEPDGDSPFVFCLLGIMNGMLLALVVSWRLMRRDIRKHIEVRPGVSGPPRATTPSTFGSTMGWVLPVAAGVFVVLSVLGWRNREAVLTWVLGGQEITVSADDPGASVTLTGQDHSALDGALPGLYVLALPPGKYNLAVRSGSGRKLESVVMLEHRGWPGYATVHGRDFEEQRDELAPSEKRFTLEVKRGQRLVLHITTSDLK